MHSTTFALLILLIISTINSLPFSNDSDDLGPDDNDDLERDIFSCYAWYLLQGNPDKLVEKTSKPPCTIPSSFPSTLLGGWTVDSGCDASKQPNTCDYHEGAWGCYRHAISATGPGAQACYDKNGHWISDPWKGAGTIDAYAPSSDVTQSLLHLIHDVIPYVSCCQTLLSPQPYTCNLYYKKRPTGTCENKPAV